jgi:PQQ-like domain
LSWLRRTEDPYFMTLDDSRRVPGLKSYGVLAAIDSRTDRVVWRKNFQSGGIGLNAGRGLGLSTTAGGLVFYLSADGNVQAYDDKTGDVLWQFQTGAVTGGGPASSYELDGEQYLTMAAGRVVWAFKLGGTMAPLPAGRPEPVDEMFKGPITDTGEIETVSLIRDIGVTGRRFFSDEYAFNPYRARVKVGTRVTWLNNGRLVHTINAQDGTWTTGPLKPAETGSVMFDKPGHYAYLCKDHPWAMAELTVVE